MRSAFLLVVLMLAAGLVGGQTHNLQLDPEKIDIYSFDPSEQASAPQTNYGQRAYEFYQEGKFDQAARYYLAHLSSNPDDATGLYNLSCCFGLLGEAKEAAKYLKIAFKKGFKDLDHIRRDKDFDQVRTAKTFTAAMDSLQIWSGKEALFKGRMEYFPIRQHIPYWVHLPQNYNPAKKYTLLIGLHGYGDAATRFSGLWRYLIDKDVIFVVPEAPYAFPENKNAAFSWTPFVDLKSKTAQTSNANLEKYIIELTKHLTKQYNVNQTWLLGFSQGAYTGYIISLTNPRYFNGLLACGGGLITDLLKNKDYKAARKLDIIISHGKQDRVVDYSEAEKAYAVLRSKGLAVSLHDFEGGHTVSPAVFDRFFEKINK